MEAELRSDILVDLEALTISIRALAFQSIQKGLKTERIRCVIMISVSLKKEFMPRVRLQIFSWGDI
jgi:hypothetical protein